MQLWRRGRTNNPRHDVTRIDLDVLLFLPLFFEEILDPIDAYILCEKKKKELLHVPYFSLRNANMSITVFSVSRGPDNVLMSDRTGSHIRFN